MTAGARIDALLAAGTAALTDTSPSPRLDAEVLLAHALERPRSHLLAWPERVIPAATAEAFHALIRQRAAGHPVAHLTGTREFWSLPLRITPAVLIPRPETEGLVERALALAPPGARVLELGTGSGAIALALARERPDLRVTATDCSTDALAVAAANRDRLGLADRVELNAGWWFRGLTGRVYDLVVTNPPYIAADEPELTAGDVRFEPVTALVADENGYADISHIVTAGVRHLAPGGWLIMEHGWQQAAGVRERLIAAGYEAVSSRQDLAGHPRISEGRRPAGASVQS